MVRTGVDVWEWNRSDRNGTGVPDSCGPDRGAADRFNRRVPVDTGDV